MIKIIVAMENESSQSQTEFNTRAEGQTLQAMPGNYSLESSFAHLRSPTHNQQQQSDSNNHTLFEEHDF